MNQQNITQPNNHLNTKLIKQTRLMRQNIMLSQNNPLTTQPQQPQHNIINRKSRQTPPLQMNHTTLDPKSRLNPTKRIIPLNKSLNKNIIRNPQNKTTILITTRIQERRIQLFKINKLHNLMPSNTATQIQ